jgi:hypothetical protein
MVIAAAGACGKEAEDVADVFVSTGSLPQWQLWEGNVLKFMLQGHDKAEELLVKGVASIERRDWVAVDAVDRSLRVVGQETLEDMWKRLYRAQDSSPDTIQQRCLGLAGVE